MTQFEVDYLIPLSLEACVTRLHDRSIQLSKQYEQQRHNWEQRRNWEQYRIVIIPAGKDSYQIQVSEITSPFINARLDVRLQKAAKNQTQVTGTTHAGRFTKYWATCISTFSVIYLLTGVEGALSVRWFVWLVLAFVGFAMALAPFYGAHRMKKDLVEQLHNWLEPRMERT